MNTACLCIENFGPLIRKIFVIPPIHLVNFFAKVNTNIVISCASCGRFCAIVGLFLELRFYFIKRWLKQHLLEFSLTTKILQDNYPKWALARARGISKLIPKLITYYQSLKTSKTTLIIAIFFWRLLTTAANPMTVASKKNSLPIQIPWNLNQLSLRYRFNIFSSISSEQNY